MKLLRNHIPNHIQGSLVAPGNFDGVHLGHQALLSQLRQIADAKQLPLVVLLFEPQPSEFFQQEQAPARLSNLREKVAYLKQAGVDYVFCLKFNTVLSNMEASKFAKTYLFSILKAKYILVGEDFRFGYQRKGDVTLLKQLALQHDCEVASFNDHLHHNQRVSSTIIRKALADSDFKKAQDLLGRPYSLCGRVISGQGLGRQWGIPTANILLKRKKLPIKGVFCVQVELDDTLLNGVANIGTRPTVDGTKTVLEIHILNFDQKLNNKRLNIIFLKKLRDEERFPSVELLIEQIRRDITMAQAFFNVS